MFTLMKALILLLMLTPGLALYFYAGCGDYPPGWHPDPGYGFLLKNQAEYRWLADRAYAGGTAEPQATDHQAELAMMLAMLGLALAAHRAACWLMPINIPRQRRRFVIVASTVKNGSVRSARHFRRVREFTQLRFKTT